MASPSVLVMFLVERYYSLWWVTDWLLLSDTLQTDYSVRIPVAFEMPTYYTFLQLVCMLCHWLVGTVGRHGPMEGSWH